MCDEYDYDPGPQLTAAVSEIYKGICQYCGADNARDVDHIIPKSKGGQHNLRNYILACHFCNTRKSGGIIAPQFLGLMTAIADKNKDRLRNSLLRLKKAPTKSRRSKRWLEQSHTVHRAATREEYEHVKYFSDLITKYSKVINGIRTYANSISNQKGYGAHTIV